MALYLEHHDLHARVLRYEPETGAYTEIARAALPRGTAFAWGFYVDHDGVPVGIYDAGRGAVLFHGAARYPLAECEFTLERGGRENRFRARRAGQAGDVVDLRYRPSAIVGTHPWDDDEMADFFLWLTRLRPSRGEQASGD